MVAMLVALIGVMAAIAMVLIGLYRWVRQTGSGGQ
jgi:hypothetical protein